MGEGGCGGRGVFLGGGCEGWDSVGLERMGRLRGLNGIT